MRYIRAVWEGPNRRGAGPEGQAFTVAPAKLLAEARSFPVCVTQSTAHFWCAKGKQSHNQSGFRWQRLTLLKAEAWIEAYGSIS